MREPHDRVGCRTLAALKRASQPVLHSHSRKDIRRWIRTNGSDIATHSNTRIRLKKKRTSQPALCRVIRPVLVPCEKRMAESGVRPHSFKTSFTAGPPLSLSLLIHDRRGDARFSFLDNPDSSFLSYETKERVSIFRQDISIRKYDED